MALKNYKIMSYPTVYSKKQGSVVKRICVEKDIPNLEEALKISKEKYGNDKGEMEWRYKGLIYPTTYKIKR